MDFKLNLLTPSLYSKEGATNCNDTLVEKFANYLKHRFDNEFLLPCKYNKVPGLAFIHSFEDFEERFLIHSEYAVIIASPYSQNALNRFNARLLVFLTSKPTWQNRFLFVFLGNVKAMSNLVIHDPIYFSLNDWETLDDESWITLFNMIKITWKPHIEEVPLAATVHEMPTPDQNNLLLLHEKQSVESAKQIETAKTKSQVRMFETRGTQGPNVTIEHLIFNPESSISNRTMCMIDSETNTMPMFKELDSTTTTILSDNSDSDSEQTFNCQSGTLEMNSKLFIQEIGSEEHLHQIVDESSAVDIDPLHGEYPGRRDEITRNNKPSRQEFIEFPIRNLRDQNALSSHSHGTGMTEAEKKEVIRKEAQLEELLEDTKKTIFGGSRDSDLEPNPAMTSKYEQEIKHPESKSDEQGSNAVINSSPSFDISLAPNTSLTFSYGGDQSGNRLAGEVKMEDKTGHKQTIGEQGLGLITTSGSGKINKGVVEGVHDDITFKTEYKREKFESGQSGSKNELSDINPCNVDEMITTFHLPVSMSSSDSFLNVADDVENTKDMHFTPTTDLNLVNKVLKSEREIDNKTSEFELEDLDDKINHDCILGTEFKMENVQVEESYDQNDSSGFDKSKTVSNIPLTFDHLKSNHNLRGEDLDSENDIDDVKTKKNIDSDSNGMEHGQRFEKRRNERSDDITEKVTPNTDSQLTNLDISEIQISTEATHAPGNESVDADWSRISGKDSSITTPLQPGKLDSFIHASDRENVEDINSSLTTDRNVKDDGNPNSGKKDFNVKTEKKFDNNTSEYELENIKEEINRESTIRAEYSMDDFEAEKGNTEKELFDLKACGLKETVADSNIPVAVTGSDSFLNFSSHVENTASINLTDRDLTDEKKKFNVKPKNKIKSKSRQVEEEVNHHGVLETKHKIKYTERENNATKTELFNSNTRSLDKMGADQNLMGQELDTGKNLFQMNIETQNKTGSESSGLVEHGSKFDDGRKSEKNNLFSEKDKDYQKKIKDISERHIPKEPGNPSKSEYMDADFSVEFEKGSLNKTSLQGRTISASARENVEDINTSRKGNTKWKDEEPISEANIHDTKSKNHSKEKNHKPVKEMSEISDKFTSLDRLGRHGSDNDNIISDQINSSPDSSQTGIKNFAELENSSIHDSVRLSSMSDERPRNISGSSQGAVSVFYDSKEKDNTIGEQGSYENLYRVNKGVKEKKDNSNVAGMESNIVPERVDSKENKIGLGVSEIETGNTNSQNTLTQSESQITNFPPDRSPKHDRRLLRMEDRDINHDRSTLRNQHDNAGEIINNDKARGELISDKYDIMEVANVEDQNQINDTNTTEPESKIMRKRGDYMSKIETQHRATGQNNIIFRNIQLFSNYLWTRVFSNRSSVSSEISGDASIIKKDFVPGYIHSPWCVVVLFITGTFVSRYWVDWSRGMLPASVNPDSIIEVISSSLIHEEAVNRKWAIISSDHEGSVFLGDSAANR